MKSIAFGKYYPGESILHRLDPRIKILLTTVYIVITFLCRNVWSFGLLLLSAVVLIAISGIPAKTIFSSIRPVLYILLFTIAINILFTGGETELFTWRFVHISVEGLYNAAFMALRILTLIVGTSLLLTYTTTPIMLTDALEQLLSPLRVIHLPVHEFAMMMTISLRFIPTLIEETDKIMDAQKARGADFTTGSLFSRLRALIPILIPLFVSAFRRADDLAVAMECRSYRGGVGRTRMNVLKMQARDIGALFFAGAFIAAVCLLNTLTLGYSM